MIKLTPERQLIHAGPSCVATKAAGITKALTKGDCLRNRKHSLTLRERWGSDGKDSSVELKMEAEPKEIETFISAHISG
ncbi:hypothetical protein P167DRAFT_580868 [Morchella conica CCBAS932]|uniref:Uncharacterized protein n=1 Tax=Morchella conica CCBAS932 TaxID=1392247 RepID=A0A3N4K9Y0_9PEZI|nr:hypothetical protein P167DRAFT_580868 [Morchella conica CCBAS932]